MREQGSGDRVVSVGEDVGFNVDQIAHGSLCRKASTVYHGGDAFDNDSFASVVLSKCHGSAVLSTGLHHYCSGLEGVRHRVSAPAAVGTLAS